MTTQPAGEHHTGTLNLAGQGNPGSSLVSDEIVQSATIAWYEATPGVSWEDAGKYERAAMLARTKLILEAAYPAIRQQIAEEIAAVLESREDDARRAEKTEGIAGNRGTSKTWSDIATGYMRSAEAAREIGAKA